MSNCDALLFPQHVITLTHIVGTNVAQTGRLDVYMLASWDSTSAVLILNPKSPKLFILAIRAWDSCKLNQLFILFCLE